MKTQRISRPSGKVFQTEEAKACSCETACCGEGHRRMENRREGSYVCWGKAGSCISSTGTLTPGSFTRLYILSLLIFPCDIISLWVLLLLHPCYYWPMPWSSNQKHRGSRVSKEVGESLCQHWKNRPSSTEPVLHLSCPVSDSFPCRRPHL